MPTKTVKSPPAHADILDELYSQKCQCGRKKAAGASFCAKCVRKLPIGLHRGVLLGGGQYDAAYLAAVEFLHSGKR